MSSDQSITILGAGVLGLWQALTLSRNGHSVRLLETSATPFANTASWYAGTMLAPECEFPPAMERARDDARRGLAIWQQTFPTLTTTNGTLVVAASGDAQALQTFFERTENGERVTRHQIASLEPALGARFGEGLYYKNEAHLCTPDTLTELLKAVQDAGVDVTFGATSSGRETSGPDAIVIDCTGMGARHQLCELRGVRGERVVVKTGMVSLSRPVRLLHLRQPIYIVPWANNHFMIGATSIESEDTSGVSVKSALDLLALAYQVHPAFGEAEIVSLDAGVRPAFPDNLPRVTVDPSGNRIWVNGAYRHGFLLAPVLAEISAQYIAKGREHPWITNGPAPCSQPQAL